MSTANPLQSSSRDRSVDVSLEPSPYALVDSAPERPPNVLSSDDDAESGALHASAARRAKLDRGAFASMLFCLVLGVVMWLLFDLVWSKGNHHHHHHEPPAAAESPALFLVETLPLENFTLPLTPGALHTHEVLEGLVNASTATLDVSVMYWNLLALSGESDDDVVTAATCPRLGCSRGAKLYGLFEEAARRGVKIRFLQDNSTRSLGHISELDRLASAFPDNVAVGRWDAGKWYGGGIMHMKLWVADGRHAYLGSANMDWLSLAQVKELGVVAYNTSASVAGDALKLFEAFWSFSSGVGDGEGSSTYNAGLPPPLQGGTVLRQDRSLGAALTVPCWEPALAEAARCVNPIRQGSPQGSPQAVPTWQAPAPVAPGGVGTGQGLGSYFLSGSPPSVLGDCGATASGHGSELRYSGALYGCERTWDLDGLVDTIGDARATVSLSVMDLWPSNPYAMNTTKAGGAVWWPALFDALTASVGASGTSVRVLVSWWAHSSPQMLTYLRALAQTCAATSDASPAANGTLEVGIFTVPGWQDTGDGAEFPAYSRVNHAKYIVTDRRANVGTSNMQWSYFYQTVRNLRHSIKLGIPACVQCNMTR